MSFCVTSFSASTVLADLPDSNTSFSFSQNSYCFTTSLSPDFTALLSEFNLLVNSLAETINEQRLVSKEQQILLHKVIVQIDVAILAVDEDNHISLMNPAAEKLFSQKFTELEGAPIHQLGLQKVVEADIRRVVEFELATIKKKVYLHTDEFFEKGIQRKLIFITDVQKMLHEEERRAWQKLVRVLSHEINNSLAPITSISDSLSQLVHSSEKLADIKEDLTDGLAVITERSQSLEYFIERYQQLSHLPMPEKSVVNLAQLLESVAALYEDERVTLCDLTADEIYVDNSQLQQVLVNLIKNALEAMKDKPEKTVEIRCSQDRQSFIIEVLDHGTGIFNSDNLFVPYYTTKAQGSGIGLALSRQIIANHGGELSLSNRKDTEGAIARISLPKAAA